MNEINNLCIKRFRSTEDCYECHANNWPYNPDMKYTKERMERENPGQLPPQVLKMKVGSTLMLLRNWRLSEGILLLSEFLTQYVIHC